MPSQFSPAHFTQHLTALLEKEYPAHLPGISVFVKDKDQVWFDQSFGLANMEEQIPASRGTNYRMASVTKQFTAMALALVCQEKNISVHQTLQEFFPAWTGLSQHITLHHLLQHRSGLLDYEDFIAPGRTTQITDEEVLVIAQAQSELYFPPGTSFRYSNTGYVLVGLVIEKITDRPFRQIIEDKILHPLGMTVSKIYTPDLNIAHRAMGYAPSEKGNYGFADQSVGSATQADGCLYTSTLDYAKWSHALWHTPTFSLAPYLTYANPIIPGEDWFYDMAWFYAPRANGQPELYHTGNTCGFSNLVIFLPEVNLTIAAFSNRADNSHLIPNLVQQIFKGLPYHLESQLLYQLPHLTR
ncbi:serine hydrolase [Rufibacter sp. LB8]|uniref:serine hydrolase domain-containing protein n=1 Tax=Rufibacter sp. LB8 TaxID=2777781 RepID=UPI00178C7B93|nr:serine hydrolase domain-containing protein [Rufibacter sp. LB8]